MWEQTGGAPSIRRDDGTIMRFTGNDARGLYMPVLSDSRQTLYLFRAGYHLSIRRGRSTPADLDAHSGGGQT